MPKQFRLLAGKPVLRWAVESLYRHPAVQQVRVVVGAQQMDLASESLAGLPVGDLIEGGNQRADSVRAGLSRLTGDAVLIHDAARPFCPADVVDRLIARLEFFDGAVPVLPVADTIARVDDTLGENVDRSKLARIQTPQAFRLDVLKSAYENWDGPSPTDESTVVRASGMKVAAVEGHPLLEKLTHASDFDRAEQMLLGRLFPRTGMGFDVHGFAGQGPIMLGGIEIAHRRGLEGHSDADVVLHAITDALLGAAALGDIGEHFSPADPRWKGAASALFLGHAVDLLRANGALIDHIDCTVIGEEPKIAPHRAAMRAKIAEIAGLRVEQISVKATTTEGLGFAGRREGIAAQAVASIRMGL